MLNVGGKSALGREVGKARERDLYETDKTAKKLDVWEKQEKPQKMCRIETRKRDGKWPF